VHNGTVDGTVRKSQKGHKIDLKMEISANFFSLLIVACVLFTKTNDWCNNERNKKGLSDQDLNPNLNFSQQKST
jgi:hypothetical protein